MLARLALAYGVSMVDMRRTSLRDVQAMVAALVERQEAEVKAQRQAEAKQQAQANLRPRR